MQRQWIQKQDLETQPASSATSVGSLSTITGRINCGLSLAGRK